MKSSNARQMALALCAKNSTMFSEVDEKLCDKSQPVKAINEWLEKLTAHNAKMPTFTELILENHFANASIRYLDAKRMMKVSTASVDNHDYLGQHLLAEFKTTSFEFTPEELEKIVVHAAKFAHATVLDSHFAQTNQFGKNGISGIVVIQESHFTVHYLPEKKLLSLDAFTCGHINFHLAVNYIISALQTISYDEIEFKRGIRSTINSEFIPGIACKNANEFKFFNQGNLNKQSDPAHYGVHAIAEFYGCDPIIINGANEVLDTFQDALSDSKVKIAYQFVHQFQPQGVSAVLLGDGFHLTIHDWPELNYGAIDLCTFDNRIHVKNVIDYLQNAFHAEYASYHEFPRGCHVKEDLVPAFKQYLK